MDERVLASVYEQLCQDVWSSSSYYIFLYLTYLFLYHLYLSGYYWPLSKPRRTSYRLTRPPRDDQEAPELCFASCIMQTYALGYSSCSCESHQHPAISYIYILYKNIYLHMYRYRYIWICSPAFRGNMTSQVNSDWCSFLSISFFFLFYFYQ